MKSVHKLFTSTLFIITFIFSTTINVPADYATIQEGLDAASEGDTVLVEAGTYVENIVWPATNSIKLIGSGQTDCIIDGDSTASVIRFEEDLGGIIDSTTLLEGFTITNGNAHLTGERYGGGIFIFSSSPVIHSVLINNNEAMRGGGFYIDTNSDPLLKYIEIRNNSSYAGNGGGIYIRDDSDPIIENTIIDNNEAFFSEGKGVFIHNNSNPTFLHSQISNHVDGFGVGVHDESSPIFDYTTIVNNSSPTGNGYGDHGGGIYADDGSNLTITNSIIWYNLPKEIEFNDSQSPNFVSIENSNVRMGVSGVITNDNGEVDWGNSNINQNPLFCDRDNNDFSLAENSPCVGISQGGANIGALSIGCDEMFFQVKHISTNGSNESGDGTVENPFYSIQKGLTESKDGDTVKVLPGTYFENIVWPETHGIHLVGSGSGNCIIDGTETANVIRFEYLLNGLIDNFTAIKNIKITNGNSVSSNGNPVLSNGGGIYLNKHCSPIISDVVIINNSAENNGGGVYCAYMSNPILENVSITYNTAAGKGGGMYISGSEGISMPYLSNIEIMNNNAESDGGGLYLYKTKPEISELILTDNTANKGGGLYLSIHQNVSYPMKNALITGNTAESEGGGIYCIGGMHDSSSFDSIEVINNEAEKGGGIYFYQMGQKMEIKNSIISDNSAEIDGGGVYLTSGSNVRFINMLIHQNISDNYGGGVYGQYSEPIFSKTSFYGNIADFGGGLYLSYTSYYIPVIHNSILWNDSNSEIFLDGADINISYSNFQGGETGISTTGGGSINLGDGNIDMNPLFCLSDSSDFTLAENSPCVGTGENGVNMGAFDVGCEAVLSTDKDGIPLQYILHHNFPNPFNPVTQIKYELPEASQVQLFIYDILGREVTSLVNGVQDAGYKSITWHGTDSFGRNVGAGMYFYLIQAGEFRKVRKMVLLK